MGDNAITYSQIAVQTSSPAIEHQVNKHICNALQIHIKTSMRQEKKWINTLRYTTIQYNYNKIYDERCNKY
jgi:hypothetical protein